MAVRKPRLPSRQLLVLLAVFTLGLASALVWLGWRLARQDRALERERVREHLEAAARRVASELERHLAGLEAALAGLAALAPTDRRTAIAAWGDTLQIGAVVVALDSGGIQAFPGRRLLFGPSQSPALVETEPAFQAAERLEFQSRDLVGAAAAYRRLASSSDPLRQAGALLRLGRVERKAGDLSAALGTYERLARLAAVALEGRPAALIAGHARIELCRELGRREQSRAEAAALYRELMRGTWSLSRGGFEFYAAELRNALGAAADTIVSPAAASEALLLSRAVDSLWQEGAGAWPDAGRRVWAIGEAPLLVAWTARTAPRLLWIATPDHLAESWLATLEPMLDREGVGLSLATSNGRAVASQLPSGTEPALVRGADVTGLPWTLALMSRDPFRLTGDLAARRRILLAGLVVASLLALLGTYVVARALHRELEVARVQTDFVSAVSHEFRTPLTSLRQLSELLASGRVPTEERRQSYYELLRRESLRLHRLVEGLLDFGRMEAGAREFRFEVVEATELVRGVVEEFAQEAASREGRIALDGLGEPCRVRADREALRLAVWNLLDNAVKYSPEEQPVSVSVTRANGRIGIHVQDRGPGIPRNEHDKIFTKFIRGQDARASGIRGTGLGLAMVRQIARAHHGEITLRSSPGAGSTFTLLLPVADSGP